eukprot:gene51810-54226_t
MLGGFLAVCVVWRPYTSPLDNLCARVLASCLFAAVLCNSAAIAVGTPSDTACYDV